MSPIDPGRRVSLQIVWLSLAEECSFSEPLNHSYVCVRACVRACVLACTHMRADMCVIARNTVVQNRLENTNSNHSFQAPARAGGNHVHQRRPASLKTCIASESLFSVTSKPDWSAAVPWCPGLSGQPKHPKTAQVPALRSSVNHKRVYEA